MMKKNILSVSSNKAMRFLLQTVFQKDCSIQSCTNVFLASSKLKTSSPYDLLIVDIDKEEADNWEFVYFVKSSPLFETPIIVLADKDQIAFHSQKKMDGMLFFAKPFDPQKLINAVVDISRRRTEQILNNN